MATYRGFSGTIADISNTWTGNEETAGCSQFVSVQAEDGNIVNFVVTPCTYFVGNAMVAVGDRVTGFYDMDLPVPFIYPPQYRAAVMSMDTPDYNVKVDFFDNQLVSRDGMLRLNLTSDTPVLLENGQLFIGSPANRNLIVVYGPTTRSIPAITTPYQIIVICRQNC